MYRFMENTLKWFRNGLSEADAQYLRESVLTVVCAALIGGMIAMAFVPSIKEAVWPVFDILLSAL